MSKVKAKKVSTQKSALKKRSSDDVADGVLRHARKASKNFKLIEVGSGSTITEFRQEIDTMMDVLLGREDPPIDVGIGTLLEVAESFHARASEMEIIIKRGESEGTILKSSAPYKFRTGELRTFLELTKRTMDLGSRRVTIAKMASPEWD